MKNSEREIIIKNAVEEYNIAKSTMDSERVLRAVNMAHNVYIMCSRWNTKGIEELRKLINAEKTN